MEAPLYTSRRQLYAAALLEKLRPNTGHVIIGDGYCAFHQRLSRTPKIRPKNLRCKVKKSNLNKFAKNRK